jgi:hypothetical protein
MAEGIRRWIESSLSNAVDLPLDNYTWRVLAYGADYGGLLNTPEYDFRYRKALTVAGKRVMGFYHGPDIDVNNQWIDGTGHMACAYLVSGFPERGYFYANQMDSLLIGKTLHGHAVRALPYTVNRSGGYEWVDTAKGFVSCAAWYIFARNGVNPLRLTRSPTTTVQSTEGGPAPGMLSDPFPNPCNPSTRIRLSIVNRQWTTVNVYDILGRKVATLVNDALEPGTYTLMFDGSHLPSGLYFYRAYVRSLDGGTLPRGRGGHTETRKLLILR